MNHKQRKAIVFLMYGVLTALVFAALFLVDVTPSKKHELQQLQIEATKLRIEILKRELGE